MSALCDITKGTDTSEVVPVDNATSHIPSTLMRLCLRLSSYAEGTTNCFSTHVIFVDGCKQKAKHAASYECETAPVESELEK